MNLKKCALVLSLSIGLGSLSSIGYSADIISRLSGALTDGLIGGTKKLVEELCKKLANQPAVQRVAASAACGGFSLIAPHMALCYVGADNYANQPVGHALKFLTYVIMWKNVNRPTFRYAHPCQLAGCAGAYKLLGGSMDGAKLLASAVVIDAARCFYGSQKYNDLKELCSNLIPRNRDWFHQFIPDTVDADV